MLKKLVPVFLMFVLCLFLTSLASAASAKYAAVDNLLTTCSITSTGTLSTSTPLVKLAGLTDCTGTDVTTNSSGTVVTANTDGPNWVVVSTASLHVSSSQSIWVTPSMVTGLYTEVKSTGNQTSTSTAQVLLRVVDLTGCTLSNHNYGNAAPCGVEIPAEPVVDCTNSIFGCVSNGNGTYGVNFDERILGLQTSGLTTTQFVDVAIATASGHSFGFGFDDVTVGTHLIAVEAAVNVGGGTGDSITAAAFGLGFTTVESVQMTQGNNDMDF